MTIPDCQYVMDGHHLWMVKEIGEWTDRKQPARGGLEQIVKVRPVTFFCQRCRVTDTVEEIG